MQKRTNKKQITRILFLFIFLFQSDVHSVFSAVVSTSYYKSVVCKDSSCTSSSTINFLPSGGASPVTITGALITGYAWGDELGWINFRPEGSGVTYSSTSTELSGYAWSETSGWINFRPTGADGATTSLGLPIGVSINSSNEWVGWAFASGKAGGWVKFDCSSNATCVKITIPATPPSSAPSSGGGFSYGGGSAGGWNSPQPTSTQATTSNNVISFSTSTKLTTTTGVSKATSSTSTNIIKTPSKTSNIIKKVTTALKEKINEVISNSVPKKTNLVTGSSVGSGGVSSSNSGGYGFGGVSSNDSKKDPTKNIFTSTSSKEKEDISKSDSVDISKVKENVESNISSEGISNSSGDGLSNSESEGKNVFLSLIEIISSIISRLFSLFK